MAFNTQLGNFTTNESEILNSAYWNSAQKM